MIIRVHHGGSTIRVASPCLFLGQSRALALVFLLLQRRGLRRGDGGYRFRQTKKLDELCELNICVIESESHARRVNVTR